MKASLCTASQSFICRCCKVDRPITDGLNTDLHLDIGNGVALEKVDKFCFLGDILDVDGGYGSAVMARVRSAWKTFCEVTCVRSCLMYGSKNLAAAISKCFFGRSSGDVA